ncbi:peptidyl-dipeptidase Dcp [Monaibacterium marinum]|uniref:Peptidyl-dipeptidase Dcp n=1 Tax=Pontivivens marinum TaxID=1690039 RepID=A0A2C9CMY5_9RHOB|nr:M3 family metallopeptidase [Monaibacterium marinum]SOH92603.1 peptidyl-dipeptidase Dcp [Monaibacterium marinum]
MTNNPLLTQWSTPHDIPPFDQIEVAHFAPAFDAALDEARATCAQIAANPDAPTFSNTIVGMEFGSALLDRVASIFYHLAGTQSDPAIEELMRALSPRMAAFSSEMLQDQALFARVDALWQQRDRFDLAPEEARVLDLYHRMFIRAGAALDEDGRKRLSAIMQRLAELGTSFTQNLLADERDWSVTLTEDDLTGLPDDLRNTMRSDDGWNLTLSRSVVVPFLESSTCRDLRETAWKAWTARGANGGPTDNRDVAAEILALRHERAQLLGFADFASYKLDTEMAKTPDNVRALLMDVWTRAQAKATTDAEQLRGLIAADGQNHDLAGWDWRLYAERQRAIEHNFDAAALKPYFTLGGMIEAAFDVSARLFGLSFRKLDIALPHPDAMAWEVLRGEEHVGVFIGDYFARAGKRSGAWCSRLRAQAGPVRPIVTNVCNFAKGDPALLTFDDARTLFHEFGHALHHLLSEATYPMVSGTSVARDFVELPSQLYEHWLSEPEILRKHARHYRTGEPIPQDLLDKLLAAETFGQGFATVEYVASALVDLDFHTGTPPTDPMAAQAETLERIGMPAAIPMRHATPQFAHIFAGDGYSAGYYSYMWSEVMDADAFAAFRETGDSFNPEMAEKLATYIYSAGGTRPPEELYTAFRGRMPGPEALLQGRGLTG